MDELKKFAKSAFDVDTILTTANDLKYTRVIQNRLAEWTANPPEDFVRMISYDLLAGRRFTPPVRDQFSLITKRAFEQLLSERINDRLKGAMTADAAISQEAQPIVAAAAEPQIVTTPEEVEGFHIVRSILRDLVHPRRIVMRDNLSYCAILLDDNNRKPVCRLRFNNTQKLAVGIFNSEKTEERFPLNELEDLYSYADRLKATIALHLGATSD